MVYIPLEVPIFEVLIFLGTSKSSLFGEPWFTNRRIGPIVAYLKRYFRDRHEVVYIPLKVPIFPSPHFFGTMVHESKNWSNRSIPKCE